MKTLKGPSGPHEISISGELFLSGNVSALASADCDNEFVPNHYVWPTVINLRPAAALPQSKRRTIENTAVQIQKIKDHGKVSRATAVFSGRLSVRADREGAGFGPKGSFLAGIRRVKGVRRLGVRIGNWLTTDEGKRLLENAGADGLRGKRNRAMVYLLIGCGLRRAELLAVTMN